MFVMSVPRFLKRLSVSSLAPHCHSLQTLVIVKSCAVCDVVHAGYCLFHCSKQPLANFSTRRTTGYPLLARDPGPPPTQTIPVWTVWTTPWQSCDVCVRGKQIIFTKWLLCKASWSLLSNRALVGPRQAPIVIKIFHLNKIMLPGWSLEQLQRERRVSLCARLMSLITVPYGYIKKDYCGRI